MLLLGIGLLLHGVLMWSLRTDSDNNRKAINKLAETHEKSLKYFENRINQITNGEDN